MCVLAKKDNPVCTSLLHASSSEVRLVHLPNSRQAASAPVQLCRRFRFRLRSRPLSYARKL
jgi:hypothetical protein